MIKIKNDEIHSIERITFSSYGVHYPSNILKPFGISEKSWEDFYKIHQRYFGTDWNGNVTKDKYEAKFSEWNRVKALLDFILNNSDYKILNVSEHDNYLNVYFIK